MAVSSYSNLFGTNGAGQQGSKAGISTMFGQQPAGAVDDEERRRQREQAKLAQQGQAAQQPTFAERQKMGQARPAPPPQAPQAAQPPMMQQLRQQLGTGVAQPVTAAPAASTGMGAMAPMAAPTPAQAPVQPPAAPTAPTSASLATTLQGQLTSLLQPGGYTDEEFNKLRAAQEANLRAEYGAEQGRLNEELARRGLSASSIGAGRMGDLAGQQARALATMQASLLGQQAELRQKARETGLSTLSDLTRTLATNEQAQAETRLKEQLGMSEIGGVLYKRDATGNLVPMTDAENQQVKTLAAQEVARKYGIAEAETTGMFGGQETLAARTQRQNLALQLAQALAGSTDPDVLKNIMPYIYQAFGINQPPAETPPPTTTTTTTATPTTSTVPVPPVTPIVPAAPGGKPGVPAPTPREVPPMGDTGKGAPVKPSLPAPATAPEAAPQLPDVLTEFFGQQPVLYPEPAAEPVAPPAPAPAPSPAQLPELLAEILNQQPVLYPEPTPELAPEPMPEPTQVPPVEPAPRQAPTPPVQPTTLEEELLKILSASQAPVAPAAQPISPVLSRMLAAATPVKRI